LVGEGRIQGSRKETGKKAKKAENGFPVEGKEKKTISPRVRREKGGKTSLTAGHNLRPAKLKAGKRKNEAGGDFGS